MAPLISSFVVKPASRCNLNCSYCYVYNRADQTWKDKPGIMSDEVFTLVLARIRRHCEATGQRRVNLQFHGGEPLLMGVVRFKRWCDEARQVLANLASLSIGIQTNGTLIDDDWIDALLREQVHV